MGSSWTTSDPVYTDRQRVKGERGVGGGGGGGGGGVCGSNLLSSKLYLLKLSAVKLPEPPT